MEHYCKCGVKLVEGNHNPNAVKNYIYICYECKRVERKAYRLKNLARDKELKKTYKDRNKVKVLESAANYRLKNGDLIRKRNSDRAKTEHGKKMSAQWRLRLKLKVFNHYCDGDIKCKHCGFKNMLALSIDHINGDGAEHRRQMKWGAGIHLYKWLIANNYPDGFQILCMNCQYIKRYTNGEVPNSMLAFMEPEHFGQTQAVVA